MQSELKPTEAIVRDACRAFCAYLSVRGWGDCPIGDIDSADVEGAMRQALSTHNPTASNLPADSNLQKTQIAPDVLDEVRDALAAGVQFIENGTEFGYIRMPEADSKDSALDTLPKLEAALAKLSTMPSGEPAPDVAASILQDVCELPGDNDPDADDTLILSVSDLQVILSRYLSRLSAMPSGWRPGDSALYDDGHHMCGIRLPVTIIREVEGWWDIRFSDGDTCIVRPSHLFPTPPEGEK